MRWSFNRLNTLLLMLLVLMAGAIIAILAQRTGAGPLDPPGAPGATQPQVEPRSPIPPVGWNGTYPIVISQPGSYFVTENLAPLGASAIDVESSDVAIDLDGFTLSPTSCCVLNQAGVTTGATVRANVVIRNGTIVGFNKGIYGETFVRSRFEDLQVHQNGNYGLDIGSGNEVSRVMAWSNGAGAKIVQQADNWGAMLSDSVISRNSGDGIDLAANNFLIRDSVIDSNGGNGIYDTGSFNTIEDSRVVGSAGYGLYLGGNRNVAVRNNVDGNTSGQLANAGAGNIVGPLDQGSGTNPSENLGWP